MVLNMQNCEHDKTCKNGEYLDINSCTYKELIFDKLVRKCEDEIVSESETKLIIKRVTYEKGNCLYHTNSLVIGCLFLLAAITIVTDTIQNID